MRLALVATTLFAAVPVLAASSDADAHAVARDMPRHNAAHGRRAAHRAFARRGEDGERRGPNGKKCRPKHAKGSGAAAAASNGGSPSAAAPAAATSSAGGEQSQNWIGQDSGNKEHGQQGQEGQAPSASASSAGASPSAAPSAAPSGDSASSSFGHELWASEPSSAPASSEASAAASSAAPASSEAWSSAAAPSAAAAPSSAAAPSASSAAPQPSPSADNSGNQDQGSQGGNNNSGGGGGDLSWLNGADPAPGKDNGEASYYDVEAGEVYCGGRYSNNDAVVAISTEYWNQITGGGYSTGPPCGKKISITWKGQTKEATVVDQCPVCGPHKIDLAQGFWMSFTGGDNSLGILGLDDKPAENPPLSWSFSA